MYVHRCLSGNAIYSFATATAWILFAALGTVRLTVCLSSSERIEGMAARLAIKNGCLNVPVRDASAEVGIQCTDVIQRTSNRWLLDSTLRNTPNLDTSEQDTLHPRGLMIIRRLDKLPLLEEE